MHCQNGQQPMHRVQGTSCSFMYNNVFKRHVMANAPTQLLLNYQFITPAAIALGDLTGMGWAQGEGSHCQSSSPLQDCFIYAAQSLTTCTCARGPFCSGQQHRAHYHRPASTFLILPGNLSSCAVRAEHPFLRITTAHSTAHLKW